MEDVKWLLRKCGLPILLLLIFVIAGVFCWGKLHAEKQKVAEEVWEPPVEIENSEAETEEAENAEISTESAYWFIPQASDDLLSEKEKEQLQSMVLSAAESVREIYKDIVIADAPSYSSGINEFTHEQRKAVVEQYTRALAEWERQVKQKSRPPRPPEKESVRNRLRQLQEQGRQQKPRKKSFDRGSR